MKEIKIEKPIYESIQTGTYTETKWETSDGKIHDNQRSAEYHEFYVCKVNQRGTDLPIDDIRIFNFQCKEDVEKYENDYVYNGQIKKYDKNTMIFPNTYVMWDEHIYENSETDEDDDYYYGHETHLYCELLEDYKKRLIEAVQNLK